MAVVPGKVGTPKPGKDAKASGAKGSYPVDTKARARNALSRVSQFGSSAEKATVRAKVKAKYPEIGQKKGKK